MMRSIIVISLFAPALAFAQAAPPPPSGAGPASDTGTEFGGVGEIVPSGSVRLAYVHDSPPMGSSTSSTTISLAPGVDYFVAPRISIGGFVLLSHTSGPNSDSFSTYGIAPRAGYNLPLMPKVSLWAMLSLQFTKSSDTTTVMGTSFSADTTTFTLAVFAPVLYHPVPHFFVGIGPVFSTDLSRSQSSGGMSADGDKFTDLGLATIIGGWL